MNNIIFYSATVLIWGSTWLAIKFQLGQVDPMLSIAYRFSFAALLLFLWCRLLRLNMHFSRRDHLFIALQGALLFALNYWLFYRAEEHLTSGLVAVVFSTMVIFNMVNGALLLRSPIEPRVLLGALAGLSGIAMVFAPELSSFSLADDGFTSLLLCLGATFSASLGNIASARNQRQKLPILQTNAYGMAYGAAMMYLLALVTGRSFSFDTSFAYVGSLLYLAVFGSMIAFGCYLSLIGRIGADRAAYTTLLFPLVALAISTAVEGYTWSPSAVAGVLLILAGNVLVLKKSRVPPLSRPVASRG